MTKNPVVWVLVADAGRARVVVPDAVEGRFNTLLPLGHVDHSHTPMPANETGLSSLSREFLTGIAHRLSEEAHRGAFNQLVMVGPGHIVHDVREKLSKTAAGCVVGTVMHDYSKMNDAELSRHLEKWWLAPAEAA